MLASIDRENLFKIVRGEVGVGKINSMIFESLRSWVIETADNVRNEDPDNLHLWSSLAALYENQGRYDNAAALCLACLEKQRNVLGDSHPDTHLSENNLGTIRQSHYMLPILKRRASS